SALSLRQPNLRLQRSNCLGRQILGVSANPARRQIWTGLSISPPRMGNYSQSIPTVPSGGNSLLVLRPLLRRRLAWREPSISAVVTVKSTLWIQLVISNGVSKQTIGWTLHQH